MRKYVLSLPIAIKIGLIVAIIFVFAFDLFLKDIPQLFPKSAEIGVIFRGLCFAFITATIFYFVTVHYPKIKNRDKTYGNVVEEIDTVLFRVHYNLVGTLEGLWEKSFADTYPTSEEWADFTNNGYPDYDWDTAMSILADDVTKRIQHIMVTPNLDITTYSQLSQLVNCKLFKIATGTSGIPGFFGLYAPLIKAFLDQCKELDSYRKTVLKMYGWPAINIEINPNTPLPGSDEAARRIIQRHQNEQDKKKAHPF